MCGIAGYHGDLTPEILRGMAANIAHRGPDGEGIWVDVDAGIGLAHRRLAIIDMSSAAAQPMSSCGGRYQIIFNGEIYNFQTLGEDLRRRGYSFNANSDTAIIAPLYDLLGAAMLEKLSGIFAFAIWDREKQELFVARDGFGVKPLYYARLPGGGVAFASELKALISIPGVGAGLDVKALSDYLTYLWSPGERTLLRDVRKLPPGHFFKAGRADFLITRWHDQKNPVATTTPASRRETISRLGELVDEVVGDQCLSDVPIGAFLSGGVDSSAVVASMVATGHAPRQTYCVGFDGADMAGEGFDDDLAHAREVAGRLGVPLTPVIVSPPTGEDLEDLAYMLDEPEADPAALYVAEIARASRADGVKVLLGGVGGDDIFSGYRRHKAAALRARTPRGTGKILHSLLDAAAMVGAGPVRRRFAKLGYMLDGDDEAFLVKAFEFNPRSAAIECLHSDVRTRLAEEGATDWLEAACERSKGRPLVERMLDLEMRGFLPDHNLNYTDKAGMAHGVEVRVPLIDQRLVDFAGAVSWRLKTTLTEEKWIFKQAVAARLPRSVLTRKKTGFGAPVRLWVVGRLRGVVEDVIGSRSFSERGVFDPVAVRRVLDDTIKGRRDGAYLILSIVLVELWLRRFIDQKASPSRTDPAARLEGCGSAASFARGD